MRILFASLNYLPRIGGITLTMHQLARRLEARGHAVAILTRPSDATIRQRLLNKWRRWRGSMSPLRDPDFSYAVYRAINPGLAVQAVVMEFRPDVVVVNVGTGMQDFACAVMQRLRDVPALLYFHDLGSLSVLDYDTVKPVLLLAVGKTLADALAERGRQAIVIPPLIELKEYKSQSSRRCVLFVNPSPRKGAEIAWALAARRPDVPFVFLESWRFEWKTLLRLLWRARKFSNIEIRRAQQDPAKVYADSKILLAPYSAAEGFSRVIAEAQAEGLPVIASDVSTLRLTGGPGAIFVPPEAPVEAWEQALHTLWDDPISYEFYVRAAREHAARKEVDPDNIVKLFESTIASVITASTADRDARTTT
jgi:glycosyltransferase involved in cell wall biosynthesis